MIKATLNKIRNFWVRRSSQTFVSFLRQKGVKIGDNTYFQNPRFTEIDLTRPSLVSIGDNCFFNKGIVILTHDWVSHVFRNLGKEVVNSSGRVTIGNNVAFGQGVTILKNVTIGDNCFIGANSLVTKSIPSNSIAAGVPAKVIMSVEDYYEKRLAEREEEAFDYARSIKERFGRMPVAADFWEEFPLFVDGSEVDAYTELPVRRYLGPTYGRYVKGHRAKYSSLDDFLKAAGLHPDESIK